MKTILVRHNENGDALLAIAGQDIDHETGLTKTSDGIREIAADDELWGKPARDVPDGIYDEDGTARTADEYNQRSFEIRFDMDNHPVHYIVQGKDEAEAEKHARKSFAYLEESFKLRGIRPVKKTPTGYVQDGAATNDEAFKYADLWQNVRAEFDIDGERESLIFKGPDVNAANAAINTFLNKLHGRGTLIRSEPAGAIHPHSYKETLFHGRDEGLPSGPAFSYYQRLRSLQKQMPEEDRPRMDETIEKAKREAMREWEGSLKHFKKRPPARDGIHLSHHDDGSAILAVDGTIKAVFNADEKLWGKPAGEVADGVYDRLGRSLDQRLTGDSVYQDWVQDRFGTRKGQGG